MIGFFSKKESIKNKQKDNLSKIRKPTSEPIENLGCDQCGLWKEVKSPKMLFTGEGKKKVLLLAECPGKSEDEQGIQLVGQAGQVLRKALEELNFDLDRDFWKTNAVVCRPTEGEKNRPPTDLEIKCCRHNWIKVVKELKPDFIFLIGEKAVKSFFMFKGKKIREDLSISRFRKLCIPDLEFNAQVISLYHPSYALRNPDVLPTFKRDLKWAVNHLGNKRKPILNTDFESQVSSSTVFEEVIQKIKNASESEYVSIDYEATGLRPFKENQEIVSVGFSPYPNESFSFPFCYPGIWTEEELKLIKNQWKIFLESPAKKIVHSHQMENIWSRHIFGSWENEWFWDTMVTAHVLDERDKYTSLDFQVFLHWGFEYGEKVEPFKRSVLETGFNRMKEVPLDELLKYNGLDALFTRKLFVLQQEELIKQESLTPAVALFNEGVKCMTEMEYIGIPVDSDYCKQTDSELALESAMLEEKLKKGEEANLFQKIHQKLPNFGSNSKDLPELLFKLLKYKPVKKTIKGKDSVDESVLQELNTELTNNILRVRKLNKIRSTYLSAFLNAIENKIHPSFNLHLARSFRSSSCIAKGTLVDIVRDISEFPKGIPIEDVKPGDLVYCYDENCNLTIRKVLWSGKTGHRKVIRLHWIGGKGKRGYLDVTPEHKIRLADGRYIEAKSLTGDFRLPGTSLKTRKIRVLALGRNKDLIYSTGTEGGVIESRFIYQQIYGTLTKNEVVHHKDRNHFNHTPNNLEKKTKKDHCKYHIDLVPIEEKQRRLKIAIRKMTETGKKYKFPSGKDHYYFLGLSKWKTLRLLAEAKGMSTKVNHDFETFKIYLEKHRINPWMVRLHYDSRTGEYITKRKLKELEKKGINKIAEELRVNYYKVIKLFELHGISIKRKCWGNQFGKWPVNNHSIIKIEELNQEVDVYNLEVEDFHNFIANEICVKNSSPNFQNIPRKDEDAQKAARSVVVPSPGNLLGEVDYGGHEVRVVCSLSQDKHLIKDLQNGLDIHSLFAEMMGISRFDSKNQFVFAEIYGSNYFAIFKNLLPLYPKLKENTVKKAEEELWKRYSGVRNWQLNLVEKYKKTGHVDMPWGFKRRGYLERNKIFNTPVQGSAFLCLLWSIIEINKIKKKEKWKSSIIGQIHDSMLWDINPNEKDHVLKVCNKIMVEDIMKENPWIIIPFITEWKFSDINGSWFEMKEE